MNQNEFENYRTSFQEADVDNKIEMYASAEGLTQDQYKELLRFFPLTELGRLEKALGD